MKLTKLRKIKLLLFLLLFINCSSQKKTKQQYSDERDLAFKGYLIAHKIPFEKLTNNIFDTYYSDFLRYEKKQKLEANPNLKVNKVYVHYRTPTSVEFIIYSDRGTFCLSTFDLDMDGKILSFPENGKIKVLEPIQVEDFGDFEITGNIIKTRKRQEMPFREWFDYVKGTIKNDTIHFTEKFVGREKKFEKKWLAKTRETDFKEVYKPSLKAVQYKIGEVLVSYEVTGEFDVEKINEISNK